MLCQRKSIWSSPRRREKEATWYCCQVSNMESEIWKSAFLLVIANKREVGHGAQTITVRTAHGQDSSHAAAGAGKAMLFRLMRRNRIKAKITAESVVNAQPCLLLSLFPPGLQSQVNAFSVQSLCFPTGPPNIFWVQAKLLLIIYCEYPVPDKKWFSPLVCPELKLTMFVKSQIPA